MSKPHLIAVVEADPSLRRLLERVVERVGPGIPAHSGASLAEVSPASGLMIYDLSAGFDELVEWRRTNSRSALVILLGAVAGLERGAVRALRPAGCFSLPFPYSDFENFVRELCEGTATRRPCRVVSWRVAG